MKWTFSEDKMKWEFNKNTPIYVQIVEGLKEAIAKGEYPSGSRIPSVRDFALEIGVNPNTVQKAFVELEKDGLLYSERTNGRSVTEDLTVLKDLKLSLAKESIDAMFTKLEALGMNSEEIKEAVEQHIIQERKA